MTQEDLVRDLSPQLRSIEESHKRSIETTGVRISDCKGSIEREVERKVRAEMKQDVERRSRELDDRERLLNQKMTYID